MTATALSAGEREALAELALLYGTFITGRWAEVMASDDEPADDWEEQAAREAVDLFAPAAESILAARLAPIEALAEEWESDPYEPSPTTYGDCAHELRAALAAVTTALDVGGVGE